MIQFGNIKLFEKSNPVIVTEAKKFISYKDRKDQEEIKKQQEREDSKALGKIYKRAYEDVVERNYIGMIDLENALVVVYDDVNIDFPVFKKTGIRTKEELDRTINYVNLKYKKCKMQIKPSKESLMDFGTESYQK